MDRLKDFLYGLLIGFLFSIFFIGISSLPALFFILKSGLDHLLKSSAEYVINTLSKVEIIGLISLLMAIAIILIFLIKRIKVSEITGEL